MLTYLEGTSITWFECFVDKVIIVRLFHSATKIFDLHMICYNVSFSALISGIFFRLGITVSVSVVPNFVSSVARMGLVYNLSV